MNREQRRAKIEELKQKNFSLRAEMADRRERRLLGEFDDEIIVRAAPPMVYKTNEDALIQPPQPDGEIITKATLNAAINMILDLVGGELGRRVKDLETKIGELRTELTALKSGAITPIAKGKSNAA